MEEFTKDTIKQYEQVIKVARQNIVKSQAIITGNEQVILAYEASIKAMKESTSL